METYENEQRIQSNEQRNQSNMGDLQNQETNPSTQQQQASYDNDGMMSPKSGNMNEDDEEMDDEDAPLPTVAQVQAKFEAEGSIPTVKLPGLDRLNDTFTDDLPTVNDLLKKDIIGTGTPLSDLAFSRPIKSIVDGISLNQKFVFIGRLFDGDINSYNKAVEELDNCINFSEAKNLMNKSLAPKYNWIMAAEEANDFLEVVGRKFQV